MITQTTQPLPFAASTADKPAAQAAAKVKQEIAAQPAADFPAAAPPAPWEAQLASADPARGEKIMAAGLNAGVQPCTSCHGVQGQPIAGSGIPRLTGQSAWYLAKQLHDYAEGVRQNVMMTQYARLLDPQQRADVAVAWGRRTAPFSPPKEMPPKDQLARGRLLVEVGDDAKLLQACSNCHGPGGGGEGDPVPYVAGQHADYGIAALQDWVDGKRADPGAGAVMGAIVAKLDRDDRRAVSAYLSTLPPPGAEQTANK